MYNKFDISVRKILTSVMNTCKRIKIKRNNTFKLIERGVKWLEIRLYRGVFSRVDKGDIIELYNGNNSVIVAIDSKVILDSIEDVLCSRLIRIGSTPYVREEDISNYYNQFYSREALKKHKVVVLKISLI